jgi:rhamnosyltransferase
VSDVTVAIPVRDGGEQLVGVLRALARQSVVHELLVCDSGSRDGSVRVARDHGARVIEIAPAEFGHGATRNLLMKEAAAPRVAFLTQDAEPADERWLERLLAGLELAADVALAFGPYAARPGASPAVRIELQRWFRSLAPDGSPCVERLDGAERSELPALALVGRRGFFTDANACVERAAWERVPFREVPYAEDRVLALDMLRAGYAKAFVPEAAVSHSHDYTTLERLRRSFDEARGLREVYGWREPAAPSQVLGRLRGELSAADGVLAATNDPGAAHRCATLAAIGWHHLARLAGSLLGSRADRLPPWLRVRLSLEGRGGFAALELDGPSGASARGRSDL